MSYALRAEIEFHTHVHRAHVNTNTISLTNSLFILWNKLNTRKRRKQAEYSQAQTQVTIKNLLDELYMSCASANSNFENKLTLTESSGPSAKRSWPFHYRDHPLSPSRTATDLSTVRWKSKTCRRWPPPCTVMISIARLWANAVLLHVPRLANPADIHSRVPLIPDGDTFKLDPDRLKPEDKPCVAFLCNTVCATPCGSRQPEQTRAVSLATSVRLR